MSLLLLLSSLAFAGESADFELVHPSFSQGGMVGVDSPSLDRPGSWRTGMFAQYEQNPLVLYMGDTEAGGTVGGRLRLDVGASYDATKRLSLRVTVPAAVQWGGQTFADVPDLTADGFGLGDVSVGARISAVQDKTKAVAVHVDATVPVGSKNAWLGEPSGSFTGGVVGRVSGGPIAVDADLAVTGRTAIDTGYGWTQGSEASLGIGARYKIVPDRLAVLANVVGRAGFANFLNGGAENSLEALAGARFWPTDALQVDAGLGHGIGQGVGTTDLRAYLGLTFVHQAPAPKEETVVADEGDDEGLVDTEVHEEKTADNDEMQDFTKPPPEPPPKPPEYQWKEKELARVNGSQIIVRDPIQFQVATTEVLPQSVPTLEYVAGLVDAQSMLIIEGHASEEGTYPYNYDLSLKRAKAIYEELVKAGVPPTMMSYRGMGETDPVKSQEGASEADLQANRRVVFYLVKIQREADAPVEAPPSEITLPWNGKSVKARQLVVPPPPIPPASSGTSSPAAPASPDRPEPSTPEIDPSSPEPAPEESP